MRKAMLLMALFGLAGSLWAADPIIGTWKLNIEKSKFPPNSPVIPKEETETYKELNNGQIEFTYQRIEMNGSSTLSVFTFPAQGGINKYLTPVNEGRLEIETLIVPGEWYARPSHAFVRFFYSP